MRRGPEGKGAGSKMPWEGLPLLPLVGPRKDQPRYPAAERRDLPGDRYLSMAAQASPHMVCAFVLCFGDLGQLHTVICGFSLVIVSYGL